MVDFDLSVACSIFTRSPCRWLEEEAAKEEKKQYREEDSYGGWHRNFVQFTRSEKEIHFTR